MKRRDRTEYMRQYREARREAAKLYAREYREAHPDKAAASKRESYLRNRPKRLAAMRRYQAATRKERKAYRLAWLRSNPGKAALYDAKRLISAATGVRIADIPPPLAEAKAAWLVARRAVLCAK